MSRSLIRNVVVLGGWTLVSRGAGFARDVMMASYLGAGPVADAFNVAFSLPNMFRRFFAEGAFNQAFVPLYSKKLEGGEDAKGFAQDAFSGLAAVLVVFTLLGTLAMPWLVWAMASGFVGDSRFDLAVEFGRITFVYIFFISLFALLSGILNAHGKFAEAGFVPVLMNLVFIAAMGLAAWQGWDMGLALAWTVPVTGVAQLAWTWWAAARAGFAPRVARPRWSPDLKRLLSSPGLRCWRAGWCRSTCWCHGRWPRAPRARFPGCLTPTGCINCPWAWWGLPLAPRCCPNSAAACARAIRRAGARR